MYACLVGFGWVIVCCFMVAGCGLFVLVFLFGLNVVVLVLFDF